MARITVEDCLRQIPNRFQLVLCATYRARMLSQGHAPKIESTVYTNRSGDSLPARRFSLTGAGTYQSVTVADASSYPPIDLNLLEHAADEFRHRGDVRLEADDNYDPGIPGRQFDITLADGRQLRAFVYMQDHKLYIVESEGAQGALAVFLFAESFTLLDAEGKAAIVEQFNAPDPAAELHSALVSRQEGKVSVLLIDATHSKLHELTAEIGRAHV